MRGASVNDTTGVHPGAPPDTPLARQLTLTSSGRSMASYSSCVTRARSNGVWNEPPRCDEANAPQSKMVPRMSAATRVTARTKGKGWAGGGWSSINKHTIKLETVAWAAHPPPFEIGRTGDEAAVGQVGTGKVGALQIAVLELALGQRGAVKGAVDQPRLDGRVGGGQK